MSTDTIAGKYKIIREIARSNDVVYEAVDTAMGRRIALKELVIPPNLTGQARRERIERFQREARASGKLSHPNIVTVYGYGEENGRYYIAMEYLEGSSLRDTLQSRGAFSIREAVDVASQVLAGLAHAHAHQVVHRDVKPDNIHILPGGQVKLTDFGIARLQEEASLTGEGQVFGTPSYMSPEQIKGHHIDFRSDLFSVGIVLYEMIAGRKPFTGDSVISITYAIMEAQPPPLNGVPYALDQAIFRALNKDPIRRFSSADEMQREIKNAESAPNAFAPMSGQTGMGGYNGFGFPSPQPAGAPARGSAFPSYGGPGMPGGGAFGGAFGGAAGTYGGGSFGGAGVPGGMGPGGHSGHTGTVFAPPPVAMPPQTAGGPFVNWGQANPNNPALGSPPPPFPRAAAGPVMSEGTRTFFRALFIAVLIGALILGGVLLFMRAFETTRAANTSQAISQIVDQGRAKMNAGDADGAIATLKGAWDTAGKGPEGAQVGHALADIYNTMAVKAHSRGDEKSAEGYWFEALKYDPQNSTVLDNLADYYKMKGDSASAEKLRDARDGRISGSDPALPGDNTRNDSRQAEAQQFYNQGKQAYEAGNWEEARRNLTAAIEKGTGTDIGRNATELLTQLNNRQTGEWDPSKL